MADETSNQERHAEHPIGSVQSLSSQDKRRTITDLLFNNAMYHHHGSGGYRHRHLKSPALYRPASIVNIISLTAA